MAGKVTETAVVGGVDTHKDLHVAAFRKNESLPT
ncbi:ISEc21 transposase [Escherichia coli]|nr:putative transposase [Escherichia coli VL2874]GDF93259.1 ISEc21 transposase [Escherichia coli]GDT66249.1 ISEc21 transposase [Escherichia coli]